MSQTLPRYEMIVFDAGGTLVSADWPLVISDFSAVARNLGLEVDPADVMSDYARSGMMC